jgi:hypothetical protein
MRLHAGFLTQRRGEAKVERNLFVQLGIYLAGQQSAKTGRAGSPLPAANMVNRPFIWQSTDGAHGVTRPAWDLFFISFHRNQANIVGCWKNWIQPEKYLNK